MGVGFQGLGCEGGGHVGLKVALLEAGMDFASSLYFLQEIGARAWGLGSKGKSCSETKTHLPKSVF